MLRSVLGLLASRHGRAVLRRAADWYESAASDNEAMLVQAVCASLDGNLERFVLDEHLVSLASWNDLLAGTFGLEPAGDHEEVLAQLVKALDAIESGPDDGLALDESPTEYPGHETLITDAVLPWVRTELVDFQQTAVRRLEKAFAAEGARSSLLVLPEGAGVVRTALDYALRAHVAMGARVVWVGTHRELLDHVHEELRELAWLVGECGTRRGDFSVSRCGCQHGDLSGDLVIASAHALSRGEVGLAEVERSGPVGLVCVEEARLVTHPRARQAIERLWGGHVRLLGLSGTAVGAGAAHEAIRDVFGPEPAYQKTFREVVDRRFLARPVFVRRRIAATEQMRMDAADVCRLVGMGQDMRAGLLREIAMRSGRTRQVVGHWLNHKDRYGRTMIFAAGPEHAEEIASELSSRGVAAEYVHHGIDREVRAQRVARFRKGYCQVLVRAGLLTESEHFPETQTVMLARPTVSAALYQRMISAAARRAAGPLSPTHFFVVDFVDGIERQGVWLAGREAAADLGSEFEDTHTGVLRDSLRRRKRRERALVSARAWQVLMRFADDQYSVWGELVWALPRGGEKSVVVFNEGVARLRAAVDRIEQTLPEGPLAPLRSIGGELDFLGAVRDIDWQEMLCDCAQTELPPRLEKVEGLMPAARVDACAQVLAELVSDVLAGRIPIPGALALGDAMLGTNEALKEHFDDATSLRKELMKLYNDAVSRIEQVQPASSGDGGRAAREEMIDAFIRFAVGVAMADGVLLDEEARAIEKAASRMFDLAEPEQVEWIYQAIAHYRGEAIDSDDAARSLARSASQPEILHMYDWLFRVAFADGVFVREEQALLETAARKLGLTEAQFRDLVHRYMSTVSDPSPVSLPAPLMPRLRYCTQCAYPRQNGAAFCVSCGAELRGGPEATRD